jgi:hypothetical protein
LQNCPTCAAAVLDAVRPILCEFAAHVVAVRSNPSLRLQRFPDCRSTNVAGPYPQPVRLRGIAYSRPLHPFMADTVRRIATVIPAICDQPHNGMWHATGRYMLDPETSDDSPYTSERVLQSDSWSWDENDDDDGPGQDQSESNDSESASAI